MDDLPSNAATIYLELRPDGEMQVAVEKYFEENSDPEHQELLLDVVSGIFGILSAQINDLVAAGKIVRSTSDFEDTIIDGMLENDDENYSIVFEPDEELVEAVSNAAGEEEEKKIIDFTKFNNPKTKH